MPIDGFGQVGSAIGTIVDLANAERNYQNQQNQQAYQRQLQQTMFDREDSSVQRRVADLKAAGLSPVLAAGQGAQAGPVVQSQAPERTMSYQKAFTDQVANQLAAVQIQSAKANIAKTEADTALVNQEAAHRAGLFNERKTGLEQDNVSKRLNNVLMYATNDARASLLRNQVTSAELDNLIKQHGVDSAKYDAARKKVEVALAEGNYKANLSSAQADLLQKYLTLALLNAQKDVYLNDNQLALSGFPKGFITDIQGMSSKILDVIKVFK